MPEAQKEEFISTEDAGREEDRRAVADEAAQTGGGGELVARWRKSHGSNRVSEKALVT